MIPPLFAHAHVTGALWSFVHTEDIAPAQAEWERMEEENQALRAALVYARDNRGGAFDHDEWFRLVEHALSGKAAPGALENEIAYHGATKMALRLCQERRDAAEQALARLLPPTDPAPAPATEPAP